MRQMRIEEFHAALREQGVSGREHAALICPVCGTVQSMASLLANGVPEAKVETQIGFSCVGRWTNAGPATRKGKPQAGKVGCDWTLGGLFRLHKLEVVDGDKVHPCFEIATADQAQELERATKG